MNIPVIALDQITAIQHVPKVNQIINALSSSALFGIMQQRSRGLNLWLYGGTFQTLVGPVKIANQRVTLTASTTNYLYVNNDGAFQQTTSIPVGWPGPLPSGARALYELDVGTNSITDGTCYLLSRNAAGPGGVQGATGSAGSELWRQRVRWQTIPGAGYPFRDSEFGFSITGGSVNSRSIALTAGQPWWVPQLACGVWWQNLPIYCRLRGFEVWFRWTLDTTFGTSPRSLFGMYDSSIGAIGNADPSSLANTFAVGHDNGDTNYYLIHNDNSGTGTRLLLTSDDSPSVNFAAKNVYKIYELGLWCDEGDGGIYYSFGDYIDPAAPHLATGFITSDIPATDKMLGIAMNVGTSGLYNICQVSGNSRY